MGSRVNRKSLLYSIVRLEKTVSMLEAKWRVFLDHHATDFLKGADVGLLEGYAPIHRPKILTFEDVRYCRDVLVSPGKQPKNYPSKATLLAFKKLDNIYVGVQDLKDWLYNLLHRQLVQYILFEKREAMQKDDEMETHEDRHREAVESFQDWPTEKRLRTETGAQMLHPDLRGVLYERSKSKRYGMVLSHLAYAIDCSKNVLMILEPSRTMWKRDANSRVMSKENEELSSALESCRDAARKVDDDEIEGRTFTKWPVSIGYIGCDGGLLRLEDTGVQLYIPQSAVAGDIVQEIYVALETGDVMGNLRSEDDAERGGVPADNSGQYVTVSPVVRVAPRHLRFEEPIMLTLPHCARNMHASKFKMAYSYHRIGKRCHWRILAANEMQMVVKEDKVVAFVTRGGCYQARVEANGGCDRNAWKVLGVGLYASPMRNFMRPDHLTLQLRIWNDTPSDRKVLENLEDEQKQFYLSDSGFIGLQRSGRDLEVVVTPPRGWTVSQDFKKLTRESLMTMGNAGGCQAGFYYCRKTTTPRPVTPRAVNFQVKLRQLRSSNKLILRCDGQSEPAKDDVPTSGRLSANQRRTKKKVLEGRCDPPILTSKVMDELCKSLDKQREMIVLVDGKAKCMDYRYLAKQMTFNVSIDKFWRDPAPIPRKRSSVGRRRERRKKLSATWSAWDAIQRYESSVSAENSPTLNYRKEIGERLRASSVTARYDPGPATERSPPEGLFASDGCLINGLHYRRVQSARGSSRPATHRYYPSRKSVKTFSLSEADKSTEQAWNDTEVAGVRGDSTSRKQSLVRLSSANSDHYSQSTPAKAGSGRHIKHIDVEFHYPKQNNIKAYIGAVARDDKAYVYDKTVKRKPLADNEDSGTVDGPAEEDETPREAPAGKTRWKNPARRILSVIISEGLQSGKCRAEIAEDLWQKMTEIGNTHARNILHDSTTLQWGQVSQVAEVIARFWPSVAGFLGSDEDEVSKLADKAKTTGLNRRTSAEVYLHSWMADMKEDEARAALVDLLSAVSKTGEDEAVRALKEFL